MAGFLLGFWGVPEFSRTVVKIIDQLSRFLTYTGVLKCSGDALEQWHVRTQKPASFVLDLLWKFSVQPPSETSLILVFDSEKLM